MYRPLGGRQELRTLITWLHHECTYAAPRPAVPVEMSRLPFPPTLPAPEAREGLGFGKADGFSDRRWVPDPGSWAPASRPGRCRPLAALGLLGIRHQHQAGARQESWREEGSGAVSEHASLFCVFV